MGNGERQMAEEEEGKDMGSVEQVSQIGTKKNKGGHTGVHNSGKTETSSESDVEIKTVNLRKREHDSEVEEEDFEENKKRKRDETHKQEKDQVNSESDSEEDKKRTGGKENVDVKVQSKCLKRRESGNGLKEKPLQRRERVQVVGSDSEHIGEAEVMAQKGVKIQRNDNDSRSESEGEKNDGASSEEASGGEGELSSGCVHEHA